MSVAKTCWLWGLNMKMRQTFNYFVLAMLLAASAAFGQRAVMVNSNNGIVVYPTNIWEANVNPLRAAIGLGTNAILQPSTGGTGATNAAGARTNLGLVWTGLTNTNATDFRSALSLSFGALTNTNAASFRSAIGLPLSALTNTSTADFRSALGLTLGALTNTNAAGLRTDIGLVWSGLTNPSAATMRSALLPSYSGNSSRVLALNSSGTDVEWVVSSTNAGSVSYPISLANGGTGATNASGARASLGFSLSALTSTSTANFRSAILPSYSNNATKVLTVNSAGTDVEWASGGSGSIAFPIAVLNGGTGATNASTARTNLGLGATWLTNTDASLLRSDIGLGTGNAVTFGSASILGSLSVGGSINFANSVVLSGTNNQAIGQLNFIASGSTNRILRTQTNENTPSYNFIGSGQSNTIDSTSYGFIGSGIANSVLNGWQNMPSSIVGGYGNTIYTDYSFIGGGAANTIAAGGSLSVISGGEGNIASNIYTVIGGGLQNQALGFCSTVGGGNQNKATGIEATVAGGGYNYAGGEGATIGGGGHTNSFNGNIAFGIYSTISGGHGNSADGDFSTVSGGKGNSASGNFSFAAGFQAYATNKGSFVWSDSTADVDPFFTFSSSVNDSFNVWASGGSHFHNGSLYVYKTNVGPFEGLANLLASNNTTLSNETLFRVGVAEQTNRSAQFGFRTVRTNNGGEGFATFSVYGYNALMMIGPSDRSRTNTNTNAGIEADIWTITPTNRVMTLRDTNTGAMVMHRPIGFNTNDSNVLTSAPANTTVTNPTGWIQVYVGTNSVRIPYYQ